MNAEQNTKPVFRQSTGRFATFSDLLHCGGNGGRAVWIFVMVLAVFAVGPAAAVALQARLFAGTFGAASNPAPFPADPYPLGSVTGVAVDSSSHDVYVAEQHYNENNVIFAGRVEKFDAAGNFLLMFGREVNKTAVEAARPESEQNVCPAPGRPADVCQYGQNPGGHAPLEEPQFIAVDAVSHDVYLSNGERTTAGVVEKFDSSGLPVESWGDPPTPDGKLTGSAATSPAGPFGQIHGLALDPSGNLWVNAGNGGETDTFEFDSSGRPTGGFSSGFSFPSGPFTVDSEDDVYSIFGSQLAKFASTGKLIGVVGPSGAEIEEHETDPGLGKVFAPSRTLVNAGLAFDPTAGDLYVAGTEGTDGHGVLRRYDSSCHPVTEVAARQPGCVPAEAFGAGLIPASVSGLAIDSSTKSVYVGDGEARSIADFAFLTVPGVVTGKPANPSLVSATLTGTVDPSGIELNPGIEGCRFEWGEVGRSYEHSEGCQTEHGEAIGSGSSPVAVHADLTGLQAGRSYHYRLVATNHNDENANVHEPSFGQDVVFGPPLVEGASPLSVSSVAAELQAEVNPRDVGTHVYVEYVTQKHFEEDGFSEPASTEARDVGSAGSQQTPNFELDGLSPHTAYRYRVVAESVLGEGPEAVVGEFVFSTQAAGSFSLLDSRGWEMVSPPNKLGARIEQITETGIVQAAASGDAITYLATSPSEEEPEGSVASQQILSTRGGGSGWSTRDLGIPHVSPTSDPLGPGPEYKFFDPELTLGVVQPFGEFDPSLSPEASEQTALLRDLRSSCTGNCYHPLVTTKEGFANVPEGTQFGEGKRCNAATEKLSVVVCGPGFVGASEDLRHVVLTSESVPLTEGGSGNELYEWAAGAPLAPVSVLPGAGGEQVAGKLGSRSENMRGAVSSDGNRIVWEGVVLGKERLYLRDMARGETVQVDAAEPACVVAHKCQSGAGQFAVASVDGSRVFFTDAHPLTAGSGEAGKRDLYECLIVEGGEGQLACQLTDLTPKQAGESAEVQGVLDAARDGSYLYFVADGVLAHNTVDNGAGEQGAQAGQPNLYQLHEGTITYVTTLSGEDREDWWGGYGLEGQPSRVSASGQWLELMSERSLTGYDNRDLATGRPTAEVYLYHAASGRLACASCDPTGARPHGVEYDKLMPSNGGLVGGPRFIWTSPTGSERNLVAANVPGWLSFGYAGKVAGHQPRYLSDEGRLFFNTVNGLVPQDSNGNQDVYEYEPPGVGSCSQSSPTFGTVSGGCVGLISSGTSREESAFLDASESGGDVFFLTFSRLVPKDEDAAIDVYDARVGGGEPELVKPVECQGDACQGFVQAPNDPTPGSLTFQGPGNLLLASAPLVKAKAKPATRAQLLTRALRACGRKPKRGRAGCQRHARSRYGSRSRKSNRNGRR